VSSCDPRSNIQVRPVAFGRIKGGIYTNDTARKSTKLFPVFGAGHRFDCFREIDSRLFDGFRNDFTDDIGRMQRGLMRQQKAQPRLFSFRPEKAQQRMRNEQPYLLLRRCGFILQRVKGRILKGFPCPKADNLQVHAFLIAKVVIAQRLTDPPAFCAIIRTVIS
jgi:hypothetical protein